MLLASSNTLEKLKALISKFYCGTKVALFENYADGTYNVHNINGHIKGVIVRKVRGRFRFEMKGRSL